MRANEPVDVMKWAIALFIFALAVGATVYLFYFVYDASDARIESMENATNSSTTERLYELQDKYLANADDVSKFPLVTTVANTLREYDEDSLLYIMVTTPGPDAKNPDLVSETKVFKYDDGISLQFSGANPPKQVVSDIPVMDAVKYLLQFSDCRTQIDLGEYVHNDQNTFVEYTGNGWMYIRLILYKDQYAN